MNIALVSLARRGGMVHFQVELANALNHLVSTSVVMSSGVPAAYIDSGVRKWLVHTGDGALESAVTALDARSWYSLWQGLSRSRADLVHVTGVHVWHPAVALFSKLLGKPLVYTVHDPQEHSGAPVSIRITNWFTMGMADQIVVLTRHGRRQLIAKGIPAHKIHVVPHGVYSFFRRWRRPRIRVRNTMLCFGRLEPYKGLETLVAAFTAMREAVGGWNLLLAGSGKLPPSLTHSVPPGIEIRNGYVPDGGVAELMQQARVVVVPYTEATQSGVIAVAYAFGRPVIATAVGGLSEMVIHGKTGLLIPPNNVQALARAMRSLATDPERLREMGRHVRDIGRNEFGWERIARMHVDLYSSVLRGRAKQ